MGTYQVCTYCNFISIYSSNHVLFFLILLVSSYTLFTFFFKEFFPSIKMPCLFISLSQFSDERFDFSTTFSRRSFLPKNVGAAINSKSLKLPTEDTPLVYRRKSSGSSTTCNSNNQQLQNEQLQQQQQQQQQRYDASFIQTPEGLQCHPDGSMLLRYVNLCSFVL